MSKHYIDICPSKYGQLEVTYYENGQRTRELISYDWYFIISAEEYEKRKNDISNYRLNNQAYTLSFKKENDSWIRCYCNMNYKNSIIEDFKKMNIQTYEADLTLPIRYWIDSSFHVAESSEFKLLYIDIEVDDSVSGLRIGEDTILSFSAVDSDGKTYQIINEDHNDPEKEIELLNKVKQLVRRYDIILGWNSKGYDLPYIRKRCQKYGVRFPYVVHIDMMQRMIHAYRFDTQIKSFSLDNIAQQFLGKSKPRTKKIIEMYLNYRDEFLKYNLNDVLLLKELNDKHNVVTMILRQAYWCNVTPRMMGEGGHGMYNLIDSLLLSAAHKKNLKGLTPKYTFDQLDKMSKDELELIDYPGGLVLDPKPGLYKNVYIFDFKTMYPSIILSSNIGFDTLSSNGTILNPAGYRYLDSPKSIFVEVLEELLTKRKEYKLKKLELIEKGLKQTPEYEAAEADEAVVKELGNSVYGITGAKWGRYFINGEIASSITLMGQWLLKTIQTFFESKGYTVITGDTDSAMVATDKQIDVQQELDEYHKYVKERLKNELNISNSKIELAFDRYFDRFILVAKKNYVGHLVNQEGRKVDYVHVRGLEVIKSDTTKIVSKTLKELIDLLLKTDNDEQFYISWLDNLRATIFSNISADDIKIHKKIRKIEDYKNESLAIIIAKRKLAKGDALVHREVDYIITGRVYNTEILKDEKGNVLLDKKGNPKKKTTSRLDGVDMAEFDGNFDKEYYWNSLMLPTCDRLLSTVFPDINWLNYKYGVQIESYSK